MNLPPFVTRLMSGASRLVMNASSLFNQPQDGPRGARYGRRSTLFEQERRQVNSVILGAGPTLRARSRFLCRENGYVINAKRVWTSYAVGTGWQVSFLGLKATAQKAMHKAFKRWTENCDIEGLTDFYGLQAMWVDEEFEAGEVFVRLVPDPTVGLKLQTIPSEQLPYWNTGDAAPGNVIRLGVEFDPMGRRVAYHFFARNPGDISYIDAGTQTIDRVPAEQILHIFTPKEAGQVRGMPRVTGAIVPFFKLDEYEDAAIERAAVASKFAGFIKKTTNDEDPTGGAGTDNGDGTRSFPMEPGMIYELDANEEWQQSAPPDPGANYDDFTRRQASKGACAVGVPYAEMTGDLKGANFSSTRIGRQPFQRFCTRWGRTVLVHQALRPIVKAWVAWGLLAGSIALPRGASRDPTNYQDLDWNPPTWEYVDPYKDAQTDALLVDHGFKDRDTVIVERGGIPEETDEKAAAAQKRAVGLGLNFATTIPSGPTTETEPAPGDLGDDGAPDPEKDARP